MGYIGGNGWALEMGGSLGTIIGKIHVATLAERI